MNSGWHTEAEVRDCIVLFYETFSTSYSYSHIGHITDPEGLKAALGSGTSSVKFTSQ